MNERQFANAHFISRMISLNGWLMLGIAAMFAFGMAGTVDHLAVRNLAMVNQAIVGHGQTECDRGDILGTVHGSDSDPATGVSGGVCVSVHAAV